MLSSLLPIALSTLLATPLISATPFPLLTPRNYNQTIAIPSTFNSTNKTSPICVKEIVSLAVTSNNSLFNLPSNITNDQITSLVLDFASLDSNLTSEIAAGYNITSGAYDVYVEYCYPAGGATQKSTLMMTHGIGFDYSYWSFNTTSNGTQYNWIEAATAAGYATVSYDRLGVGKSSHPNGINVTQINTEVELAEQIAQQIKNGSLVSGMNATNYLVGIGHSFGSIITQTVSKKYSNTFSSIILTGFSTFTSIQPYGFAIFGPQSAYTLNSTRFGNLSMDASYLLTSTYQSDVIGFFYPGGFDKSVALQAEATKQTFTLGEMLAPSPVGLADRFYGDVLVVTGDHDFLFCGGSCYVNDTSYPAMVSTLYPNASSFESYLPQVTGHGLNLHYSAPVTYKEMLDWLKKYGH